MVLARDVATLPLPAWVARGARVILGAHHGRVTFVHATRTRALVELEDKRNVLIVDVTLHLFRQPGRGE